MHKILQDKEIAVLESLKASMGPMGSWNLVEKLEEKGYYISSATIGRILNSLEKRGYAKKTATTEELSLKRAWMP